MIYFENCYDVDFHIDYRQVTNLILFVLLQQDQLSYLILHNRLLVLMHLNCNSLLLSRVEILFQLVFL